MFYTELCSPDKTLKVLILRQMQSNRLAIAYRMILICAHWTHPFLSYCLLSCAPSLSCSVFIVLFL